MRRLIPLGRVLLLALLLVVLNTGGSAAQDATPGILITEILAANTRTVTDDQGRYADWIELHNPTDAPIALAGYTLTDDPDEPAQWRLPFTTLAPGAFLVVWASGENWLGSKGWHTSFRLNNAGEYVGLFGPDGQVVDEVTFGEQEMDVSLGRLGTRSDQWVGFLTPTPGAANTTRPRAALLPAPDALPVVLTPSSGFFVGPVSVELQPPVPGSTVYYTLDGADPTMGGQAYTVPLELRETTVLRAVALNDGVPVSTVTTATYLVGEGTGLPVVSLVMEPAHLWDAATGLYTNPEERGRAWERPVEVEWLPPEGEPGFNVGAGLRIHGNVSRLMAKQSFRLYFRGEYGPRELAYPLFGAVPGQTYDQLVLRGGFNDSWPCNHVTWCNRDEAVYVRDQLMRDLHGAMGQVAARGRWVAVYLNGAYWGVYNLTERVGDVILATHFGHDDWDLVAADAAEAVGNEHVVAWDAFVDWITGTDLSAATWYEQAARQLDIENFTSFILLRLWAGDIDWGDRNWYAARMRYGPDTRWRLLVWDAEVTFGLKGTPSIQAVIDNGASGPLIAILTSLLANPQYQAYFTAQVERHLAGALATESVRGRLSVLSTALRPAIPAEAARWRPEQEPAVTVAQWEAALQRLSDSLEASEQRLRYLSDPETLRPLLPELQALDAPALLPPETRIALLVHHPAELSPGDAGVVTHLAARGVTVNVIGTTEGGPYDPALVAANHDLLLLSSSVRQLDKAARYAQTTTPLIFWEPRLLAAERVPLSPWGGTRPEQTEIRIVDADHPVTAGLPADQMLRVVHQPDTLSVAYPPSGSGVQVLAKHLFGNDSALLVAEVGAELANGQPAQARIVFLFWHHNTFHQSTGEAIRLFDRAVDWALGLLPDDGA